MHRTPRSLQYAALLAVVPGQAVAAGMPQLRFKDPLVWSQIVWGAVIFIGFYLALSRSALPKIERVLANRRHRIQSDLDIARRAKDEADAANDALQKTRHDAAEQARAHLDRIRQETHLASEAHARASEKRLEHDLAQAEERIARSHEAALKNLPDIAAHTAQVIVERLIGGDSVVANRSAITDAVARAQG